MSDAGPIRLELTGEAERPDARLRLFGAALTGPASLVVLSLGDPGAVRVLIGLAGLAASLGWLATYRGHRSRRSRVLASLELREGRFTHVREGERIEAALVDIQEIDLDDDAASLTLVLRDGRRITLAPGYGGLGTLSLHRLLEHHRDGAKPREDG